MMFIPMIATINGWDRTQFKKPGALCVAVDDFFACDVRVRGAPVLAWACGIASKAPGEASGRPKSPNGLLDVGACDGTVFRGGGDDSATAADASAVTTGSSSAAAGVAFLAGNLSRAEQFGQVAIDGWSISLTDNFFPQVLQVTTV
ncbi:MAG: hypothetical protein AAGJ83_07380 [Planctomycetota bacterium]